MQNTSVMKMIICMCHCMKHVKKHPSSSLLGRGWTREPRHIPCSSELLGPVRCHWRMDGHSQDVGEKRHNKRAQTYFVFLRASWACSLSLMHGQSQPRCRGEEAEQESPDVFHVPQSFLGLFIVTDTWTVTSKMSGRRALTREPRYISCSSELLGHVHYH